MEVVYVSKGFEITSSSLLVSFNKSGEIWARLVDNKVGGKLASLLGSGNIDQQSRVQLTEWHCSGIDTKDRLFSVFINDLGDEMEYSLRYVGKRKPAYITPCSNKERRIIDL